MELEKNDQQNLFYLDVIEKCDAATRGSWTLRTETFTHVCCFNSSRDKGPKDQRPAVKVTRMKYYAGKIAQISVISLNMSVILNLIQPSPSGDHVYLFVLQFKKKKEQKRIIFLIEEDQGHKKRKKGRFIVFFQFPNVKTEVLRIKLM